MYLRFEEDAPLITVYRTGKFIITGADSEEESYSLRERFLNLFSDMDVIEESEDEWFTVQNYVCTGELNQNQYLTKHPRPAVSEAQVL
jgi:transcription initiation factor TFIID TATA-box-binding protein